MSLLCSDDSFLHRTESFLCSGPCSTERHSFKINRAAASVAERSLRDIVSVILFLQTQICPFLGRPHPGLFEQRQTLCFVVFIQNTRWPTSSYPGQMVRLKWKSAEFVFSFLPRACCYALQSKSTRGSICSKSLTLNLPCLRERQMTAFYRSKERSMEK